MLSVIQRKRRYYVVHGLQALYGYGCSRLYDSEVNQTNVYLDTVVAGCMIAR